LKMHPCQTIPKSGDPTPANGISLSFSTYNMWEPKLQYFILIFG